MVQAQDFLFLSSAVVAILVGVLKCRTQFWKRTTQESFHQSLVEIGPVVSEEIEISSNGQNCSILSQKV
jgi:hypothetical protein